MTARSSNCRPLSSAALVEASEGAAQQDQERDPGNRKRQDAGEQGDERDQAKGDGKHDAAPGRAVGVVGP
jgi:hypothetical protein